MYGIMHELMQGGDAPDDYYQDYEMDEEQLMDCGHRTDDPCVILDDDGWLQSVLCPKCAEEAKGI